MDQLKAKIILLIETFHSVPSRPTKGQTRKPSQGPKVPRPDADVVMPLMLDALECPWCCLHKYWRAGMLAWCCEYWRAGMLSGCCLHACCRGAACTHAVVNAAVLVVFAQWLTTEAIQDGRERRAAE